MKKLFILRGLSGVGKSTLIKELIDNHQFNLIKNFTTRPPRKDDFEYDFYSKFEVLSKETAQISVYNKEFYGVETFALNTSFSNNIMVGNPEADATLRQYLSRTQSDLEIISVYIRPDLENKQILDELTSRLTKNNRQERLETFSKEQNEHDLYATNFIGKSIIIKEIDTSEQVLRLMGKKRAVFFGGKYDKRDNFIHDYRYRLTNGLCMENRGSFNLKGTSMEYLGGFYFEEEGIQDITHSNIDFIVKEEMNMVLKCDIFVAYLNEYVSTGTLAELIYAASLGKEIIVYYAPKVTKYKTDNPYWFATLLSSNLSNVKAVPVRNVEELLENIKGI